MNMKKIAALLAVTVMAASMPILAAEETVTETAEDVVLIAEEVAEETTEEVAEEATEETTEEVTEEEGLVSETEGTAEEVVIEEVEPAVVYPENAMVVNGVDTGKTVVTKDAGVMYVPVRAMCEAMGMEVQWDGENEMVTIVDLPLYITFSPYADGFTFARTAPMMLGTAPFLTEGTTYVPLEFITELLNATYSFTDNGAIIIDRIVDKSVVVMVTAKGEEDGNVVLTVDDAERGEVVVVLSPETVIENEQGESKTADDIAVDAEIRIEYSEAMTMSIPPIANAVKIVVADAAEETAEEVVEAETEETVEAETEETVETEEVAE